ncbi:hypothetical protein C0991_010773 [Blastosporella zonata]|nr:hypothetical protein C0991_010773 [Blastosporella zonata]
MSYRILVASLKSEIYTLTFTPREFPSESNLDQAPCLILSSVISPGSDPSWIIRHPDNRQLILTSLQKDDGEIVAIKYNNLGEGQIVGRVTSSGDKPPSILATTSELFVANYRSGTVCFFSISPEPPYFLSSQPTDTVQLHGSGPKARQASGPRPHQVFLHPDRSELLVPDLASDKTWRFQKDQEGHWRPAGHASYDPGDGPRHVAIYRDTLYTVCELSNRVFGHHLPPLPEEARLLATSSTMQHPLPHPNDMIAGEILIPPPNATFPAPFLYVSNRNNPSEEGDSIAIFDISDPEKLALVAEVRTGLKHVRGMEFGGPDDRWLIAGGMDDGIVKIFERTEGGRGLKCIGEKRDIAAPTGFIWL